MILTVLFWYGVLGLCSLAFSGVMFYNIITHPRLAANVALRIALGIAFVICNFLLPVLYAMSSRKQYNRLGLTETVLRINWAMMENDSK